MIGAFRQWSCEERQAALHAGDTLLIYSDGVTEAESSSGEEFGEDRLLRCLREGRAIAAESLAHCVVENVNEFSHGERFDDVTVVAVRAM
jgi:phosphoserine phosphatase RsbU/P